MLHSSDVIGHQGYYKNLCLLHQSRIKLTNAGHYLHTCPSCWCEPTFRPLSPTKTCTETSTAAAVADIAPFGRNINRNVLQHAACTTGQALELPHGFEDLDSTPCQVGNLHVQRHLHTAYRAASDQPQTADFHHLPPAARNLPNLSTAWGERLPGSCHAAGSTPATSACIRWRPGAAQPLQGPILLDHTVAHAGTTAPPPSHTAMIHQSKNKGRMGGGTKFA